MKFRIKALPIFVKFLVFLIPVAVMPFLNDSFALPKAFLFWMFIPLFFVADDFTADKEEIPVYFLTAVYLFLSIFSIYPMLSFTGLYRYYFSGFFSLFAGFALFRILRNFPESVIKQQLGFLLFSALLTCAAVFSGGGGRISSTFGNPNFYGGVLAALIPYALYFSLSKTIYGLHFIFFAVALLMTFSRASWTGGAAGILIFIFTAGKKRDMSKTAQSLAARNVLAAAVLILAGAFIISPHFTGEIFKRALSAFDLSETDIVSRFEGYAASLSIFAEKPFFGHGPESFSILFRSRAPVSFVKQLGGLAHAGYSHCYPLQILTETGLAGFGAWFFLIFVLIKKAFTSKELFKKAAGASVIAFVVTNLFAFPSITEMLVFWFSAAVIYGPSRRGRMSVAAGALSPGILSPQGVLRRMSFLRAVRILTAIVLSLLLSAPLVSEALFVSAAKNPDDTKTYVLFRRSVSLLPSDYHLMNAGKRCLLIYDKTNSPAWIDRGEYFFEKLIKRNPRHALALNGAGVASREKFILYKDKKYALRAESFFEKAVENDPYLKAARFNLARLLEQQGKLIEAAKQYGKALEIYSDDELLLFNAGVVNVNSGNPDKALEFWYRLREINPDYKKLRQYIKRAEEIRAVDGRRK